VRNFRSAGDARDRAAFGDVGRPPTSVFFELNGQPRSIVPVDAKDLLVVLEG